MNIKAKDEANLIVYYIWNNLPSNFILKICNVGNCSLQSPNMIKWVNKDSTCSFPPHLEMYCKPRLLTRIQFVPSSFLFLIGS